jgi:hypothetical protein
MKTRVFLSAVICIFVDVHSLASPNDAMLAAQSAKVVLTPGQVQQVLHAFMHSFGPFFRSNFFERNVDGTYKILQYTEEDIPIILRDIGMVMKNLPNYMEFKRMEQVGNVLKEDPHLTFRADFLSHLGGDRRLEAEGMKLLQKLGPHIQDEANTMQKLIEDGSEIKVGPQDIEGVVERASVPVMEELEGVVTSPEFKEAAPVVATMTAAAAGKIGAFTATAAEAAPPVAVATWYGVMGYKIGKMLFSSDDNPTKDFENTFSSSAAFPTKSDELSKARKLQMEKVLFGTAPPPSGR